MLNTIWWGINVITCIKHLAQCLPQSWQTLFLIYFSFVNCLACLEFIMEMKCETTLRGLEITQILLLRDRKEDSRKFTLYHQHFLSSMCGGFLLHLLLCHFSKWTFFSSYEIWRVIFFLSWPEYFQFGMTLVSI